MGKLYHNKTTDSTKWARLQQSFNQACIDKAKQQISNFADVNFLYWL